MFLVTQIRNDSIGLLAEAAIWSQLLHHQPTCHYQCYGCATSVCVIFLLILVAQSYAVGADWLPWVKVGRRSGETHPTNWDKHLG